MSRHRVLCRGARSGAGQCSLPPRTLLFAGDDPRTVWFCGVCRCHVAGAGALLRRTACTSRRSRRCRHVAGRDPSRRRYFERGYRFRRKIAQPYRLPYFRRVFRSARRVGRAPAASAPPSANFADPPFALFGAGCPPACDRCPGRCPAFDPFHGISRRSGALRTPRPAVGVVREGRFLLRFPALRLPGRTSRGLRAARPPRDPGA